MVAEVLEWLEPQRGGLFVDGTVGLGGHASALLAGGATPSLSGRGSSPLRNAVTITKPHYTLLGTNVRIQGLVAYKGA